jgi:hypothetical protein
MQCMAKNVQGNLSAGRIRRGNKNHGVQFPSQSRRSGVMREKERHSVATVRGRSGEAAVFGCVAARAMKNASICAVI